MELTIEFSRGDEPDWTVSEAFSPNPIRPYPSGARFSWETPEDRAKVIEAIQKWGNENPKFKDFYHELLAFAVSLSGNFNGRFHGFYPRPVFSGR